MTDHVEVAILGGGCFWCIETLYSSFKGIISAESGYTGGHVENPTYEQVCGKETGHVEVVKVTFDPSVIEYKTIIECFFDAHDPTTPNRQGNDVGPQYRSAIFVTNEEQREIAQACIQELEIAKKFSDPIVTAIEDEAVFYKAESYHQGYCKANPTQPYCQYVVHPKVEKFTKQHADKLKD